MKKSFCSKSKKQGNAAIDLFVVLIILLAFAIMTFSTKTIIDDVNEDIQADPDFHNESKDIIGSHADSYAPRFDGLFLMVFILLWVLVIAASYQIDSHPIFFAITFILLIAVFFVSVYLGNAYEEITTEDGFIDLVPVFPIMNWIMTHLLTVAIIVGFSILFVLYGKMQGGSG